MFKNIDSRFDYADMYNWTNDIPEKSLDIFLKVIDYINSKNNPKEILEIGTFTGTSAIKLVETIKNSKITVIDKWENYVELDEIRKLKENNIEKIFYDNIEKSGLKELFTVLKGDSFAILLKLIKNNKQFDVIYVDGNHELLHSYLDIKLSFELLKTGGILILDDVPYNRQNMLYSPYEGVINFLNTTKNIKVIDLGYRFFLEKL